MTSGSIFDKKSENSGQLLLTRRSKLLAFHVKNFNGSFLSLSLGLSEGERQGFFAEPSFSIGLKKRFIIGYDQISSDGCCSFASSKRRPSKPPELDLVSSKMPASNRLVARVNVRLAGEGREAVQPVYRFSAHAPSRKIA
ncbi:hypothetical protein SLA2020_039630 [Shorea laevis]